MNLNLTPEREKLATVTFERVRAAKETEAESLQEYLEGLLQPEFEARAAQIVDSWRPQDSPEDLQKRKELVEHIETVPAEKLEAALAAIEAIKAVEAVEAVEAEPSKP